MNPSVDSIALLAASSALATSFVLRQHFAFHLGYGASSLVFRLETIHSPSSSAGRQFGPCNSLVFRSTADAPGSTIFARAC